MFCSTCGVAVSQRLSFCNHCGAKLVREESLTRSGEVRPESLVFAMLATFVFGLFGATALLGVMKAVLNLEIGQLLFFAALIFLIMLMLEAVFIRTFLRQTRRASEERESRVSELPREQVTNELDAAQARALAEPVPSVTEHTTRAFEPIYTERK